MRILVGGLCAVVLAMVIPVQTLNAAGSCAELSMLALPNATITLAQAVEAGAFTPPGGADGDAVTGAAGVLPRRRDAEADAPTPTSRSRSGCRPPTGTASSRRSATAPSAATIAYPAMTTALAPRLRRRARTDTGHTGGSAQLRARASGEGDRFRLARGARDDRRVEEDHRRATTAPPRSSRTGTAAPPADGRR